MLGSYSRCATRALRFPCSSFRARAGPLARSYASISLPSPRLCRRCAPAGQRVSVGWRRGAARGTGKKEEDLGQFLSHKPADRAAPIKNASLRMAIGPQRGSGGNAEPRALSPSPSRAGHPPATRSVGSPPRPCSLYPCIGILFFALSPGTRAPRPPRPSRSFVHPRPLRRSLSGLLPLLPTFFSP